MKKRLAALLAALLMTVCAAAQGEDVPGAQERLLGRWLFFSGGELLGAAVEFGPEGALQAYTWDDWTLEQQERTLVPLSEPAEYALAPAPEGVYPEGVTHELRITRANGECACYGLQFLPDAQFGCEAFGVFRGEAGGGYHREGQSPVMETDGWG